jgi:hypothetical protein
VALADHHCVLSNICRNLWQNKLHLFGNLRRPASAVSALRRTAAQELDVEAEAIGLRPDSVVSKTRRWQVCCRFR